MKNNFFLVLCFLYFLNNVVLAESVTFNLNSTNIEILPENNKIIAGKGMVTSSNGFKIYSDNFEYLQDKNILKVFGNAKAVNELNNIEIKSSNAIFDGDKNTINAYGNVEINQFDENIIIKGDKLFYDYNKKEISSNDPTIITDNQNNIYKSDSFYFKINEEIIKINNLEYIDNKKNFLKTDLAYVNTKSGKLFGKDLYLELNNFSNNEDNEPRLKGRSITNDIDFTKIDKGVFTACKRNDDCPPWELSSKKITYDKKNQLINYDKAILRLYDFPIMYFPKFFHPSPEVKRKSGFLVPSFQNSSNLGNYLNLPYFYAMTDNKDATFYPRLFLKDKFLLQTEYRQVNKTSKHLADISYLKNNSKNKSKNHFFYNFNKKLDLSNFEDSNIKIKTQRASSDTYLKSNKIKSNINFDENLLENSIDIDLYSENLDVDINSSIFENLTLESTDRYEYIFPKINISKKINSTSRIKGDYFFNTEFLIRNYDTNSYERHLYNNINFKSDTKQSNFGLLNNYEFLIKNLNSNNRKTKYKDDSNFYFSGIYQFNSSLPLIKDIGKNEKVLEPKLSLKISPSHTKDLKNSEKKIDINNVYSINRLSDKDTTEGGISLTYGGDYSYFKEKRKILDIELANNLRLKKNDDIQNNNQMGEKNSNIFGKISYNPNNYLNATYDLALKNNIQDISEENLSTTFNLSNFSSTFEYYNQNNSLLKNTYITNKTTYSLENNSISFSTRKNKTKDLTEYYNLMYQYKNDCLAASIEYNKDFYNDREVFNNENLMFKLTIIPVGGINTPNLRD